MNARQNTLSERADALEYAMTLELERIPVKSPLYTMGEKDPTQPMVRPPLGPGEHLMLGQDKRLAPMPKAPTLFDFFRLRVAPANHLLQSARHAQRAGASEKVILACLLHDFSVLGFIRADHGYWGAQLFEPYVDEEVTWAIRAHQALRFFPDPSVGYEYPELYVKYFGADYRPEPYVCEEYERARNHKWYMTARLITVNDIYSFDPDMVIEMREFEDIVGRNFRQPKEGLGFDGSPVAHMWRTLIAPTRYL